MKQRRSIIAPANVKTLHNRKGREPKDLKERGSGHGGSPRRPFLLKPVASAAWCCSRLNQVGPYLRSISFESTDEPILVIFTGSILNAFSLRIPNSDIIGVGDTFTAAFAVALVEKKSPLDRSVYVPEFKLIKPFKLLQPYGS